MSVNNTILKFFAALFIVMSSSLANAQQESRWIGTDGNWSDAANWDNGVPAGLDTAVIQSQAGQITQDVSGLTLARIEFESATANLVLQKSLTIEESLFWNEGKISGNSSLVFFGDGQINEFVELETTFDNFGFVEFGVNGEFATLRSGAQGAWINRTGSVVDALNGVRFRISNGGEGIVSVEPNSTFKVSEGLQTSWDFTNDGRTEMNEGGGFFFANYFQSENAELILGQGSVDFFQTSILLGLVSGTGGVGNLNDPIEADLVPGGQQIGFISTIGDFVMTPSTVCNFQIGPNLTADRISNSGGPLQLNGTLNIEALPGATPGTYLMFSYNNGFMLDVDDIQLGSVPNGFRGFLVHEQPMQRVNLVVEAIDPVFLGDVNRDGSVDLLDVQPFVQLLASDTYQPEADINGDGEVNLLDINGFIALLSGG